MLTVPFTAIEEVFPTHRAAALVALTYNRICCTNSTFGLNADFAQPFWVLVSDPEGVIVLTTPANLVGTTFC